MKKLVLLSLLFWGTQSLAGAPWSDQTYISKNVDIHKQGKGNVVRVKNKLNLKRGDEIDAIVVVAASKQGKGVIKLVVDGQVMAKQKQISTTLEAIQLPLGKVLRRGEKVQLLTNGNIQISSIGAIMLDDGGSAPVKCQYGAFKPAFQQGLNKTAIQTARKTAGGANCKAQKTRAMPNCYKFQLSGRGSVGARLTGINANNRENFMRGAQSGTVCLGGGRTLSTVQKRDTRTRVVLKLSNPKSNEVVQTVVFPAHDEGDVELNGWYRKRFHTPNN